MNYEEIVKGMETQTGFYKHKNYHIVDCESNIFIMRADITEDSLNPYGYPHGGLIFGLGDTTMGMLARRTGTKAVTRSANITYLKPAVGKYIIAKAEMVKCGKTACFLKADILNDKDEIIAVMTGDYYFID